MEFEAGHDRRARQVYWPRAHAQVGCTHRSGLT